MLNYLKKYFGYSQFRPHQQEIITHILEHKDCLVLMPTGGGKSICFQLPALMMEGTAVVVSPLISLMKDQVDALKANGINAAALNSNATESENLEIRESLIRGELKLLYISPEKLITEIHYLFKQFKISLWAIDEAHCISQWGHDFRPEYAQLGQLRSEFPGVPVAAFTATADKATRTDIIEQLHLQPDESGEVKTFISSFDRPNLSLDVRRGFSADEKLRSILSILKRHKNESGIIYCLSRANTEKLAEALAMNDIKAKAYHAGMSPDARNRVQEEFINEQISVVCATIAFGMGIDKSNVRFVMHYNMPKSIEGYYQEIGRGGRDGLNCETILYYSLGDIVMLKRFANESGQAGLNQNKLAWMQKYAESNVCRRRILLNYFGESMDHDCGNCDICKNPPQRFDGTVLVQKALSAIFRANQSIGVVTTIQILRGIRSAEVVSKQYDKLKTFGVGHDISEKDWQDYILQMIQLGFLEYDLRSNGRLIIMPPGTEVLFGRASAMLAVINREDYSVKSRKKSKESTYLSEEDEELFEILRGIRSKLANEQNVPPYVIFNDRTLQETASIKPVSKAAFSCISGVGVHKLESYGDIFVNAIRNYLTSKGQMPDAPKPQPENSSHKPDETSKNDEDVQEISVMPHKSSRKKRDYITIKGVQYPIEPDLVEYMPWRKVYDELSSAIYWTLWHDKTLPLSQFIPASMPERSRVVENFAEIVEATCGVIIDREADTVFIPQRFEYDENGNKVHSLENTSFDDGLSQLTQFLDQNQHFPFVESSEYECSLRRWMQEVNVGIIETDESQRAAFDAFLEKYKGLPRTKRRYNS